MVKKFSEWVRLREMAGTGVVMGQDGRKPDVGPDAQVWGAPETAGRAWPSGVERPRRPRKAGKRG